MGVPGTKITWSGSSAFFIYYGGGYPLVIQCGSLIVLIWKLIEISHSDHKGCQEVWLYLNSACVRELEVSTLDKLLYLGE